RGQSPRSEYRTGAGVKRGAIAVGMAFFMSANTFMSTDAEAQRATTSSAEEKPVAVVGDRWLPIGGGAMLAALASHSLDTPRREIETAVIVVHGLLRNADVYYANMMAAVRKADAAGLVNVSRTLAIAPQFLIGV